MAIDSLVNMQQMFGAPTPDPVAQRLQAGLSQQRSEISNNVAQDKIDKNQKLYILLYALGGALQGDEDFAEKTIQLQQMQEGKKKEKAKKAKYDDFVRGLPEGTFKDLARSLGPDRLDELLLKKYEAEQPKPIDPSKAIKQEELMVLQKLKSVGGDMSQLNDYERTIYDNYVKRNPDPQSIISALLNQDTPSEPLEITEVKE